MLVEKGDGAAAAAAAGAGGGQADDRFGALPKPRTALRPFSPHEGRALPPTTVWALVVSPPAGVGLLSLLVGWGRRWRRRRRARQSDPATMARRALRQARAAADPKDAAAAAERALHLAIEAATGMKSRAVLLSALGERLRDEGLDEPLADEIVALLEACAVVRFEPALPEEGKGKLAARARATVNHLLRAELAASQIEAA